MHQSLQPISLGAVVKNKYIATCGVVDEKKNKPARIPTSIHL